MDMQLSDNQYVNIQHGGSKWPTVLNVILLNIKDLHVHEKSVFFIEEVTVGFVGAEAAVGNTVEETFA